MTLSPGWLRNLAAASLRFLASPEKAQDRALLIVHHDYLGGLVGEFKPGGTGKRKRKDG